MNRLIYTLLLLLICLPAVAQKSTPQPDLTKASYIIDERTEIDFVGINKDEDWSISNLTQDDVIKLENAKGRDVFIPFYGLVSKNSSGEIFQLDISDPLMKYGTRRVLLDVPIAVLKPESETKMTGYSVTLGTDDIDPGVLYQLPIRPDSVRISINATVTDSKWSDISLRHNNVDLENRSFVRQIEIERSVYVKISPFDWAPVNSVAPMIDWDKSHVVEQRIFIASGIDVPYGIVEQRNDNYNVAVLSFEDSTIESRQLIGVPQIKAVPNPVIRDVRFEVSNVPEGRYTIKIKNILGEVKVQKTIEFITPEVYPLNIDGLSKGSYFYILEDSQGNNLSTKRLIVLKP